MPVRFERALLQWQLEAGSLSFVFGEVIESRIHFFTFGTGENTPIHAYDHNGDVTFWINYPRWQAPRIFKAVVVSNLGISSNFTFPCNIRPQINRIKI